MCDGLRRRFCLPERAGSAAGSRVPGSGSRSGGEMPPGTCYRPAPLGYAGPFPPPVRRSRFPGDRRTPRSRHRRRGESEFGPSGASHGSGADGLGALEPAPDHVPDRSRLAGPGPLRAFRGARVHAAVRAFAPCRLSGEPRRHPELPAMGKPHPGTSGNLRDSRGRGHHRTARAGRGELRGHGDRGAGAPGAVPGGWWITGSSLWCPTATSWKACAVRRLPWPANSDSGGLSGSTTKTTSPSTGRPRCPSRSRTWPPATRRSAGTCRPWPRATTTSTESTRRSPVRWRRRSGRR